MPSYSPEVIETMRAALNAVVSEIPAHQATTEVKACMAEIILKAAAEGQTNYHVLLAAASEQLEAVLSQLTPPTSIPPIRN